jgi:hypothetical protein
VLEQGNTGWYKIQSVFAWARMWGAPIPLAYALARRAIVALAAARCLAVAQRRAYPLKAAALCLATILATPYSFDYDMMVLAPAIAFLAADGIRARFRAVGEDGARGAVAGAAGRPQRRAASLIPLGVPAMLAAFCDGLAARRSRPRPTLPRPLFPAQDSTIAFSGAPSTMRQVPAARRAATTSPRSSRSAASGRFHRAILPRSWERRCLRSIRCSVQATATRRGSPWRSSAFPIG